MRRIATVIAGTLLSLSLMGLAPVSADPGLDPDLVRNPNHVPVVDNLTGNVPGSDVLNNLVSPPGLDL